MECLIQTIDISNHIYFVFLSKSDEDPHVNRLVFYSLSKIIVPLLCFRFFVGNLNRLIFVYFVKLNDKGNDLEQVTNGPLSWITRTMHNDYV